MRRRDVATGAAFFALGLGAAWLTAALPHRTLPNTPGPAFFPWVVVIALLALAAMLVGRALTAAPASQGGDTEPGAGAGAGAARAPALAMLAAFAAYIALLPQLGFLIATAPFFAFLMVLYGERRAPVVAGVALVTTCGLYLLFRHGFQIILPQGVLTGLVP